MILLHLISPNVICINQQSVLLMYSSGQKKGGYSRGTLYHTSKWKGRPPPHPPPRVFNTIKYIKIRSFFAALHPLLQNAAFFFFFFFFTCLGELMFCFKDFLFCYVRYYLSLVTRKPVFGVFGQLRFNLVCSATDVT